jgi:hypothetical protein
MAMVRIVARVELRICTTSRTKGHNHLKKDTIESEDEKINAFPIIAIQAECLTIKSLTVVTNNY